MVYSFIGKSFYNCCANNLPLCRVCWAWSKAQWRQGRNPHWLHLLALASFMFKNQELWPSWWCRVAQKTTSEVQIPEPNLQMEHCLDLQVSMKLNKNDSWTIAFSSGFKIEPTDLWRQLGMDHTCKVPYFLFFLFLSMYLTSTKNFSQKLIKQTDVAVPPWQLIAQAAN